MIGAVESYLKNCFKTILTFIYPEKIGSNNTEKIIRRYSFQNLDSLVKAYSWLCPDFEKTKIYKTRHPEDFYEKIDLYDSLKEMLDRRHRIVHESFYFDDFDENLFNFFSWLAFTWATNFDYFFTDNKYYDRIDEKT